MKRNVFLHFVIMYFFIISLFAQNDGKIFIFHAGSLSKPFKEIETAFEKKYPQFDILREASGSNNAARKVSELNKRCEIIASADYFVIDELLIDTGNADWNIHFVSNEMSIMYTPESKYAKEINSKNWYEILQRPGVEYGHSDPNADPCGYRTLLTWQLAEKHYKKPGLFQKLNKGCKPSNIRSAEVDMIALLESGQIDYLFIYRSVSEQHKKPYVVLADQINLKSNTYADFYKNASVKVRGATEGSFLTMTGMPMVYGFTIPKTCENKEGALLFAQFLLSAEGKAIMEANGQPALKPAIATGKTKSLPKELLKLVKIR